MVPTRLEGGVLSRAFKLSWLGHLVMRREKKQDENRVGCCIGQEGRKRTVPLLFQDCNIIVYIHVYLPVTVGWTSFCVIVWAPAQCRRSTANTSGSYGETSDEFCRGEHNLRVKMNF